MKRSWFVYEEKWIDILEDELGEIWKQSKELSIL